MDVEVEIHPDDPEGEGEGWDDVYRGIRKFLQFGSPVAPVAFDFSADGYSKLVVYCADGHLLGGYKLNGCVGRLTQGKKLPHTWAGPLLMMRKYSWESIDRFGHVNSKDLESAIKFFGTYGSHRF